ncbi:MAG TPA: methyl-accepting chemotaxis protein [Chloroflexia bacterium]|nr:methyl-accepting chemotaxis protein [Chloroflexia bacterium]
MGQTLEPNITPSSAHAVTKSSGIARLWRLVTAADHRYGNLEQRRTHLLNAFLLVTGLGLIIFTVLSQLNSLANSEFSFLAILPEVGGLFALICCYLLNRTGKTTVAAVSFFTAVHVIIDVYLVTRTDERVLINLLRVAPLMILTVIGACLIIRPLFGALFALAGTGSLIIIGVNRTRTGLFSFGNPVEAITELAVPVCMLFMIAWITTIFEKSFLSLVNHVSKQNKLLDSTNQELASKRQIEQELTRKVDDLTAQLSRSFEEQNQNTSQQVAAVLKVSTSMEELSQANLAIANSASRVDSTAQQALQAAENGTENVRDGLKSLVTLNEQVQAVALAMKDLYRQAGQIDQIIELITEIAEETNILALNATIEAAGAREYGRRFASVANEVQRLSNRSREAADHVAQIVVEVRKAIESSSDVAQKGLEEADKIITGTLSIEQALQGMVALVGNTAGLAREIAVAIQQQRVATVEVVETMRDVSQISQSVVSGNENLLGNLSSLNHAVATLNAVAR